MFDTEVDEDLLVSAKTWDKLSSSVRKDGFREGAAAGREKSFQKGFDKGYILGHKLLRKAGYEAASKKFSLDGLSPSTKTEERDTSQSPWKDYCIMCPKLQPGMPLTKRDIAESAQQYENQLLDDIIEQQKNVFN